MDERVSNSPAVVTDLGRPYDSIAHEFVCTMTGGSAYDRSPHPHFFFLYFTTPTIFLHTRHIGFLRRHCNFRQQFLLSGQFGRLPERSGIISHIIMETELYNLGGNP
jgi:hypothetical protein